MSHDDELEDRVRAVLAEEPGMTEKRMFGGLAFLVDGRMAVAARNRGGVMVRLEPGQANAAIEAKAAKPVEMRGSVMRGWIHVDAGALESPGELTRWVRLGIARARAISG